MRCRFDKAYQGQCENVAPRPVVDGPWPYCEEHKSMVCCFCGKHATRECDHAGQFVCGYPLCDDCVHDEKTYGHKKKS